jgi:5-methylcytosine-specific restriction endonuclease McrA
MIKKCLNCDKEIKVKPSHYDRKKFCSRQCQSIFNKNNPPDFWRRMSKRKKVNCSFCGNELLKKPSEIFKTNFCNHKCKNEYQIQNGHLINQHLKRRVEKVCEICGKKFNVPKNREITSKYCSKHCLGLANGRRGKIQYKKQILVKCSKCGKEFEKKPSTYRSLNFCSTSCMGKYYSESHMFSGENSGTWNGGDISYYGPNWLSQRRLARKRDKYTCQDCGKTEKQLGHELSVHHIKPFRVYNGDWEKANELSNLISLCEYPCHRRRHSKMVDDIV